MRRDGPAAEAFSYRVGIIAILGACVLGSIGCGYGTFVGLTTGELSTWEWLTVPLMGVFSASTALLVMFTGGRHMATIVVVFTSWLVFYLLSNLFNALYVLESVVVALVYFPWFLVLYALVAAMQPRRRGIHLAWAIYAAVVVVALPAGYRLTGLAPGAPESDALIVNLFAQPAFIALLYAMTAFRERFAAAEARAAALAENAAELEHLAYHDTLTGLPNRALVGDRLETALAAARRAGGIVAVHALDLDHFKDINDSLGHAAGDAVLVEVAGRLAELLRETDTVGRMGGDEFIVVQASLRAPEDALVIGGRMIEALSRPMTIEGRELVPAGSIGTTLWIADSEPEAAPGEGREQRTREQLAARASVLVREADAALFAAKGAGRNEQRLFEPDQLEQAESRLKLRSALRRAIAEEEFVLHYQPQIDLETGALVGAEALIRWNDPEYGLRAPATFIAAAERSGAIVAIGDWVLREACRAAAAWPKPVKIEVNVSPVQIERGDLVASVERALAASGLAPERLELELTESVFANADSPRYQEVFTALAARGVRIAVDDFGTGYSSLLYLRNFPIGIVKIDRAFVSGIEALGTDYAIVKAIVTFAGAMGMTVIAEGIEREGQAALLRQEGCRLGQGYWLSPPLDLEDFRRRFLLLAAAA